MPKFHVVKMGEQAPCEVCGEIVLFGSRGESISIDLPGDQDEVETSRLSDSIRGTVIEIYPNPKRTWCADHAPRNEEPS